jgi:hypothetical protein
MEYLVDENDESLIGKDIYLRSPMTCSSLSDHRTICRRCYGDLYYTNKDINVGKYAAENLSSELTQRLLSTKHLLETAIEQIKWNENFGRFMSIEINSISLSDEIIESPWLKKSFICVDPDNISLVYEEDDVIKKDDDEDDDSDNTIYNEYLTEFYIKTPTEMVKIDSEDNTSLYLSAEFNNIIRKKAVIDDDTGLCMIPLDKLTDINLFYIQIVNNEISKTMNDIINVINKKSVTENMTKDEALQSMVDLVVTGNINIDSVHLEVLLANQIIVPDTYTSPNWNDPSCIYKMITLNSALVYNRSVIVSLLYKDLHKVLYNPLTFKKKGASFFDLFYMKQPQVYMDDNVLTTVEEEDHGIVEMVKYVDESKNKK